MLSTYETRSNNWGIRHWATAALALWQPEVSSVSQQLSNSAQPLTDRQSVPVYCGADTPCGAVPVAPRHRRDLKRARVEPPHIEIVVAHHQESLSWLDGHRSDTRVYHKGGQGLDDDAGSWHWREDLNNIGMESHTYLTHLARRYHVLADVTLFTQAGIQATVDEFQGIEPMLEQALKPSADLVTWRMPSVFRCWGGMIHTYKWLDDYNAGRMRHAGMSPAEFWRFAFGPDAPPVPQQVNYIHEATFAVSRHAIKRRPQEFYARLLAYFEALNHTNPEEGHYMERLWLPIFAGAGRSVVHMPDGQLIPTYPAEGEVNFIDDITDGTWVPQ